MYRTYNSGRELGRNFDRVIEELKKIFENFLTYLLLKYYYYITNEILENADFIPAGGGEIGKFSFNRELNRDSDSWRS